MLRRLLASLLLAASCRGEQPQRFELVRTVRPSIIASDPGRAIDQPLLFPFPQDGRRELERPGDVPDAEQPRSVGDLLHVAPPPIPVRVCIQVYHRLHRYFYTS
jgi:hypothetical protein